MVIIAFGRRKAHNIRGDFLSIDIHQLGFCVIVLKKKTDKEKYMAFYRGNFDQVFSFLF
jgi:hypothetical protein